jgi:hypothetical protein
MGTTEMQRTAYLKKGSRSSSLTGDSRGSRVAEGESGAELQRLAVEQGCKGEQVKQQSCREKQGQQSFRG